MKSMWGKFLSCFLAANIFMLTMMTSAFAAKVTTFVLDGKDDGLDVVLNEITDQRDWQVLDAICKKGLYGEDGHFKKRFLRNDELTKLFNKEIRSNYGNTLVNIFRNTEFNPGYGEILLATAKKLGLSVPDKISDADVQNIEKAIILERLRLAREYIIKEKGRDAWEEIEKKVDNEIDKDFEAGKYTKEEYSNYKKYGVAGILGGVAGAGILGSLSGFLVYQLANTVFFSITGALGLGIGVAVGGPIVATVIGIATNPMMWGPAAVLSVYILGDTNWYKTIESVSFIALKRQQFQREGR